MKLHNKMKLTERNIDTFWQHCKIGHTYSYSMSFMLNDIQKLAKANGFWIRYNNPGTPEYKAVGSLNFTIVSNGVDVTAKLGKKALFEIPQMTFIPTAMNFCIEVTRETFLKIMEVDSEEEEENNWGNTLFNKLDKIDGISSVDYNGHFGANIWLQMDLDFSIRKMAEEVKQIIKEHVK